MPSTSPRHGAVYAKELAIDLLARGYKPRQVFDGTGISPDIIHQEKPFVAFEAIASFFEHAVELTGEDTLGFDRGAQREMRRSGVICYVGMAAPTVLDFIKNVARYRRVFSDAVEIDVDQLDSDGILRWYFAVPTKVRRRQYVEFGASGLLHAMRQAANREFRPRLVTFHHMRNSNQDRFRQYFGCDVRFGEAENAYHFRREDLDLPLLTADNDLYSVLTEYCEAILSDKSRNLPPLIVDVERAIADRLAKGEASQEEVARAMGMSPRTLSRRLAAENTTFFKTLEQLRRALAVSYLKDSDLVLAEIAFLLGYSGLSSFNDAFKRWTGQTPGQFRLV
ncbi:AraC family transcriptional regulator ligand-binding domain-containing protein [Ruegeria sp. 2205SS24-7]|uniref:AraC family transcriptional regulator n=1 Tax=Ruegeria discodermiae TaxID=3064389 RepID=UPI002740D3A4|nr:AraC family transcriptional regulator ligand-binding domain-containing protein [Ruegeria sp. 2205SS24-7]MDP5218657.1 AraC family transcriptional regulator ligand-binding domain-containing protein [Ruegeria sp. 2205SS24-7]